MFSTSFYVFFFWHRLFFFLGDEVAKPCASCGVVDTSLDCMHQRTVKSRGAIGADHMMQPAPRSLLSTMSYFV